MRPVRLRAHHYLCMLTYVGEGYSRLFKNRFDAIIADINRGRRVELVIGPDDVCAGLSGGLRRHCASKGVRVRDAQALRDLGRRGLRPGAAAALASPRLKRLRRLFSTGAIRSACALCPWSTLCDRVAREDFAGCKLR